MLKILVFLYKLIYSKITRVFVLSGKGLHPPAAMQIFQRENPTCIIETCSLSQVKLGHYSRIFPGVQLSNVKMGNFSYVSNNSVLTNVEMGDFCSMGPHIKIGLAPHPTRGFVSTYPGFFSKQNDGCVVSFRKDSIFDESIPMTVIGHDVWICSDVIIPGNITIGTGSIIAAGSVVIKDVPPYAIVGGNPARVIRYRFSEEEIDFLLKTRWWNWPIDMIRRNVDEFSDIKRFMEVFSKIEK